MNSSSTESIKWDFFIYKYRIVKIKFEIYYLETKAKNQNKIFIYLFKLKFQKKIIKDVIFFSKKNILLVLYKI